VSGHVKDRRVAGGESATERGIRRYFFSEIGGVTAPWGMTPVFRKFRDRAVMSGALSHKPYFFLTDSKVGCCFQPHFVRRFAHNGWPHRDHPVKVLFRKRLGKEPCWSSRFSVPCGLSLLQKAR
jgi:hypothetical protein